VDGVLADGRLPEWQTVTENASVDFIREDSNGQTESRGIGAELVGRKLMQFVAVDLCHVGVFSFRAQE